MPICYYTPFLSMNKVTARPLLEDPRRCAHQERLGGRHANHPRLWTSSCYYIVFFSVLPFVLSISASPKTNKPRGRALDVSTISTCFSLCYNILPTPPPNLCENGWGYHCRVLVWLLALYAKLNWFFAKMQQHMKIWSEFLQLYTRIILIQL